MNAAVRDNLNVTVGEEQVHENAIVVFRVPDPKVRKNLNRTFSR
jgi:hypothetical protein